ncbi:hypothetical protein HG530_012386 [Fusarium avenaceum]|nr:hypothetical protein HG530_012386 [Fusarium avenaceum]
MLSRFRIVKAARNVEDNARTEEYSTEFGKAPKRKVGTVEVAAGTLIDHAAKVQVQSFKCLGILLQHTGYNFRVELATRRFKMWLIILGLGFVHERVKVLCSESQSVGDTTGHMPNISQAQCFDASLFREWNMGIHCFVEDQESIGPDLKRAESRNASHIQDQKWKVERQARLDDEFPWDDPGRGQPRRLDVAKLHQCRSPNQQRPV